MPCVCLHALQLHGRWKCYSVILVIKFLSPSSHRAQLHHIQWQRFWYAENGKSGNNAVIIRLNLFALSVYVSLYLHLILPLLHACRIWNSITWILLSVWFHSQIKCMEHKKATIIVFNATRWFVSPIGPIGGLGAILSIHFVSMIIKTMHIK